MGAIIRRTSWSRSRLRSPALPARHPVSAKLTARAADDSRIQGLRRQPTGAQAGQRSFELFPDVTSMTSCRHRRGDGALARPDRSAVNNAGGSTVVPWQVLQSAVEAAKGRRLLFVDTCHSGNAYNQRLGNAAYHANIIAYTASRFDQEALEDAALGHGLFTYAVVEGLEGKGDVGGRRQVSTRELASYLVRRVRQLAKTIKGEQEQDDRRRAGAQYLGPRCAGPRAGAWRSTSRAAMPRTTCWRAGRPHTVRRSASWRSIRASRSRSTSRAAMPRTTCWRAGSATLTTSSHRVALLAVLLQLPLLPEPSAFSPASMPIATSAAIRLYSIAVVPRSSCAKLRTCSDIQDCVPMRMPKSPCPQHCSHFRAGRAAWPSAARPPAALRSRPACWHAPR